MSLHYLLDGYNIIHQMPRSSPQKLEEERGALIRFIEVYRPQGSFRNAVTIVFDGKPGMFPMPSSSSVKTIFTAGESADEKIKRIVAESRNQKNWVVVTDDRDIQYAVRAMGAEVCPVQDFLGRIPGKKKVRKGLNPKAVEENKDISKTLEFKITSEFEKIWLKRPPVGA